MSSAALALRVLALAGFLGGGFVLGEAQARPGGGHSFSGSSGGGGGSPSSGGGGGGSSRSGGGSWSPPSSSSPSFSSSPSSGSGAELTPMGAFIVVVALGAVIVPTVIFDAAQKRKQARTSWDTGSSHDTNFLVPTPPPSPRLERLCKYDANFSAIALEDYLHELYARAHRSRTSDEELALLAPYLAAEVRAGLRRRGGRAPQAVGGIVVGSCTIQALHVGRDPVATIEVEFEANYEETPAGGGESIGFWALERWTLQRSIAATSRSPAEVRAFGCPSCGAPVEHDQREACAHCGTRWDTNDFEWQCTKIRVPVENPRPPALGGYAEEQGSFAPTIVDPECASALDALVAIDPGASRTAVRARVEHIYRALNEAWSSLAWEDAKSITTDRFWLSMTYWIEAYRKSRLRNRMEQARVLAVEFVKVRTDAFYWAITVRIRGSAVDTTVMESGALVGGNPLEPREYSEYWTLVRSVPTNDAEPKSCGFCGAVLATNVAGNCDRCGAKFVGGASDWVLSKIEQDEAYRG